MKLDTLTNYTLFEKRELNDLNSTGYLLEHNKTKAKVVVLENEDENKVFTIGFKTPPKDSTGVAHIVEHTVLCGSEQFPAKDPFIELAKGSLNTFLNAMTYPDKTVYPVASCNDKDFQNLMHVYLDAVFHPNIYKEKKIFEQEGWHYEIEQEEDEIHYNGVVYNEMKGVFSSPDQLLDRLVQKSLFPDNAYGVESGGEPEAIPDLTYEEFLKFHQTYYHPSNSYIYLYGNMDMLEKLAWIDREYLSKYDYLNVDSEIKVQKKFDKMKELMDYYSVTKGEGTRHKTYFSYNAVIGDSLDQKLYLAFQVLDYVLVSMPGAPVKQALIDAGIGEDILSSYDNGIMQPVFSIVVKNADSCQKEEFLRILFDTLNQCIKEKLNSRSLEAAINYYEFKYREADFGQYPKGLMYGLQIFDSWLYDGKQPFIHVEANKTFAFLKEQIGSGYYESLIQKYLLDNTHSSCVCVEPKEMLTQEIEKAEAVKLAEYKQSLSQDEVRQMVQNTKALRDYQEEPSPKEDLEKIPLLKISDIRPECQKLVYESAKVAGATILKHDLFTNGIAYLTLGFDVTSRKEYAPYLNLIVTMLGYVDTKNYTYFELSNEIDFHTGGIVNSLQVTERKKKKDFVCMFNFYAKVLYEKIEKAFELIGEMIQNTLFEDEKRFHEVLVETKARYQVKLQSSGHTTAVGRSSSYQSEVGFITEMTSGIGFYQFLCDLDEHFDEKKEITMQICQKLMLEIFRTDNLLGGITADTEGIHAAVRELEKFIPNVLQGSRQDIPAPQCDIENNNCNEGFKTAGKIQFVARTGNFIQKGVPYSGTLKVVRTILSYDYLWNQVRVKGGAYGAMCGFTYNGNGYFVSYRDPNLERTNEVYCGIESYLENFSVDERGMTKYLIGTISDMDVPLTPRAKGVKGYNAYLAGITDEDLQRERTEVLSTNVERVRQMAPVAKAIMDCNHICVIGNEEKIEENKELFYEIKSLT